MGNFKDNDSVQQAGRLTGNRDLVTTDNIMKWVAQGKVFEAGQGIQTDAMDSQGENQRTPDDVKATFALVSPLSTSPLVVPLVFKVIFEVEGGCAADYQLIFTKASRECGTDLALSGRDVVSQKCLYAANPALGAPKATAMRGVDSTYLLTVSALVDADQVMYDYTVMVDNNVSVPLIGSTQQRAWCFFQEGAPHILTSGAAMIFYINSQTTDAKIHPYVQWAELELDDLI